MRKKVGRLRALICRVEPEACEEITDHEIALIEAECRHQSSRAPDEWIAECVLMKALDIVAERASRKIVVRGKKRRARRSS